MTEDAALEQVHDVGALAARFTSLVGEGKGPQALGEALALSPRDDAARVAAALCWSLLGNPIKAGEELAGADPARLAGAALRAYRALEGRLPQDARAVWEAVEARREANLRVLAAHQPDLAERLRAMPLDPAVTWIRSGDALTLVELDRGVRVVTEVPSPGQVAELSDLILKRGEPVLLGEMRCGLLLSTLAALRPPLLNGMQVPIFVLEPSIGRFLLHLAFGRFEAYCGDGNVRFFVGPDPLGQLLEAIRRNPFLPVPRSVAYAGAPGLAERVSAFLDEAEAEVRDRRASFATYYAGMTPRRMLERLDGRGDGPPRILCVTGLFTTVLQYVTRDVSAALESLGCRTLVLKEPSRIGRHTIQTFVRAVDEFRPDVIFTIDHIRPEHDATLLPPVPYVCWIQDPMPQLFDPALASRVGDLDFTYVVVPEWRQRCLTLGYPEVGVLPMAVNPELFCPGPADPALACDVAFASNVKAPAICAQYPRLLPLLLEEMRDVPIGTIPDIAYFDALLSRVETRIGARANDASREAVVFDLSQTLPRYRYRVPPLQWAREAGLHVKLFGEGWSTIPELAPLACGSLANGEPLRNLYRSAKVNLHINQGGLNLHQRVFECLASGGFLLARALPSDTQPGGLGESFEIGREIVTFAHREDCLASLARDAGDESARREAIEAGRARVLAGHTYAHRMRVVLADIRARLQRLAAAEAR